MECLESKKNVKEIIIDYLEDIVDIEIKPESRLVEDLGMDSLYKIEVILGYEDLFGCEVPLDEGEKWETVQDAINYAVNNNLSVGEL